MRKLRFEDIINLSKETEPSNNRAGTWTQACRARSEVLTAQLKISFLLTLKKQTNNNNRTKNRTKNKQKRYSVTEKPITSQTSITSFSSALNGLWNNLLTAYF